jgi:hypothetical protein
MSRAVALVLIACAALVGCTVGSCSTMVYADRNFGADYYCR